MDTSSKKAPRRTRFDHTKRHDFDHAMAANLFYAGVDEVGRGCLAGPVVAAAVVPGSDIQKWRDVDDSKRLSTHRREELASTIWETACAVAIGIATVEEIDALNILRATQLAMGRAVAKLSTQVEIVLVDGNQPANTSIPSLPVVNGDARSLSIAAASIVAKVHRDHLMQEIHVNYPVYGFDSNVGYGTKAHLQALQAYGPTIHHRTSFAPVRQVATIQTKLVL